MEQPLLSICIPTYNRAAFLFEALKCLKSNLQFCKYDVELIVSDNCSSDNTQEVVNGFIAQGLHCMYIRNQTNIGPDGNFVQCFRKARGNYIWLIGDDDYLMPNALETICSFLKGKQYGLVHVQNNHIEIQSTEYGYIGDFLSRINIMITFMSANIINRTAVSSVNAEEYYNTNLVQVPFYISAALTRPHNLYVEGDILNCGHNANTNGGYNFFRVFMDNYFSIWDDYLNQGALTTKEYEYVKRTTFECFHIDYIFRTLIGQPSQSLDMSRCKRTTLKYFGTKPYLYIDLFKRYKNYYKAKIKNSSIWKRIVAFRMTINGQCIIM